MNTYTLTVTVHVEAMHLFPAIMAVQDALKPGTGLSASVTGAWVEWDREDPQSLEDFEGAKRLLAPADIEAEIKQELNPEPGLQGACTCSVVTEGRWDEEHDPGCPAR